jgi:integrase
MTRKRGAGDGGIDARGENIYRLRYRVGRQRFTQTFHGTLLEARKELRRLVKSGDDGAHIVPTRLTLSQWSQQWLSLLARGETNGTRRGLVGARTAERYRELLALYVLPTLGERSLQQLTATEIDDLYIKLEQRVSTASVRHVHVALRACLAVAVRKRHMQNNPAADADPPRPVETDAAQALDSEQLKRLLDGFRGSVLYPIVCTAAFTGVRLGELLALRWSDLDPVAKTLRIERTIEQTSEHGRRLKEPKSRRGLRTIVIDDALLALLLAEREKYLRVAAGVPDRAQVDLSLLKLSPNALMFPSPPMAGEAFDFARLRNPKSVTKETRARFRRLGFATLRFHDLRASHGTALLDAHVPVHVVAARLGHDAAVLLKAYAKRTRQADTSAAAVIATMAKGIL